MESILKLVTDSFSILNIPKKVCICMKCKAKKNHQHRQIDRINFHLILNENYVAIHIDASIYCVFVMNS